MDIKNREVSHEITSVARQGDDVILGLAKGAIKVSGEHPDLPKITAGSQGKFKIGKGDAARLKNGEVISGTFLGIVVADSTAAVRSSDKRTG